MVAGIYADGEHPEIVCPVIAGWLWATPRRQGWWAGCETRSGSRDLGDVLFYQRPRPSPAKQHPLHLERRLLLDVGKRVGVDVHGEGDGAVPQHL